MSAEKHIYPISKECVQREEKEQLLNQKAAMFLFIGLSGSGKSTLAKAIERSLHEQGFIVQLLDGDNLRVGLNNNLGFSAEDRKENIRRMAETSKLFVQCGVIVLASFIAPTEEVRAQIFDILGEDLNVIFVDCPLSLCEERDPKGLYKKARKGEIKNFTGIDSPFEAPSNPFLRIDSLSGSLSDHCALIEQAIIPKIKLS